MEMRGRGLSLGERVLVISGAILLLIALGYYLAATPDNDDMKIAFAWCMVGLNPILFVIFVSGRRR